MRLLTYNIKDGATDEAQDRLELVAQLVAGAHPDVLFLQEANGFHAVGRSGQPSDRCCRFERATGLRGHVLPTPSGSFVAVYLAPEVHPVRVEALKGPWFHGALSVEVQREPAPNLVLVATHLHPFGASQRSVEAQTLAWYGARRATRALVAIAGDFNSVAPADVDLELRGLAPRQEWNVRLLDEEGRPDTMPWRWMDRAGLVDCFRRANPSDPGLTDPTPAFEDEGARTRLDYLFVGPSLAERLTSCRVVREDPAPRASDHYPVLAEFELGP
ncbi:MAG: endonuclease/exonuclease/phosphatase family protein [Candidatus Riflebacteria bacterium]|nr:endonuclease/exonuclease/phosphatase family protein [Candidatus Riflebacteria bacterium]